MPVARAKTPEISWPDGSSGRLAGRFRLEPTSGFRRLASGRWGFYILGIQVAELNPLGWLARANGTGSISPLAMGRISDPAADGNETSLDVVNAAGTTLGRLSSYRVNATSWGWKLYSSTAGALGATADLTLDGTGLVQVRNGLSVLAGGLSVLSGGLATRASGTGSVTPLAIARVSDPAADGNETSLDFSNAANTPLARLSSHRISATSWGWKLYSSSAGALQATPAIIVGSTSDANDVTISGRTILGGGIATAASSFSFLDTAFSVAKGIKVGNLVVSASYSDTPPTNGIYSSGAVSTGALTVRTGGLNVQAGAVTFAGALTVSGAVVANFGVTVSGGLVVTGGINNQSGIFYTPASFYGFYDNGGGGAQAVKVLSLVASTSFSDTAPSGGIYAASTASVSGLTVRSGGASITGGMTIATGSLAINAGNISVQGSSASFITGGLQISTGGLTVVAGGLSVQGGANSFTAAIFPQSDNAYTLGGNVLRWFAVYAVTGTIQTSSREFKDNLAPLDPKAALRAILATPLYEYEYVHPGAKKTSARRAPRKERHVGFMADEADPMLLVDGESVSPQTTAAVALAAIKALDARLTILEAS